MTITINIIRILILLALLFLVIFLTYEVINRRYSSKLIHKERQFNVLRIWLSHYFNELPNSLKKEACRELTEIIIEDESNEELIKWYKFFFTQKK